MCHQKSIINLFFYYIIILPNVCCQGIFILSDNIYYYIIFILIYFYIYVIIKLHRMRGPLTSVPGTSIINTAVTLTLLKYTAGSSCMMTEPGRIYRYYFTFILFYFTCILLYLYSNLFYLTFILHLFYCTFISLYYILFYLYFTFSLLYLYSILFYLTFILFYLFYFLFSLFVLLLFYFLLFYVVRCPYKPLCYFYSGWHREEWSGSFLLRYPAHPPRTYSRFLVTRWALSWDGDSPSLIWLRSSGNIGNNLFVTYMFIKAKLS